MKLFKTAVVLSAAAAILASCATSKSLAYLQDMEPGVDYPALPAPELTVQEGDRLDIEVACKNPQLALPFNVVSGTFSMETSDTEPVRTSINGEKASCYVVDKDGFIDFPVLGPQKVIGMTLKEVKESISSQIIKAGYIKEPIVTVNLGNFIITLIGETGSINYEVPGNSINLIQAIAEGGDLTMYANLKDLWVIRTENGIRHTYSVNMYSKDLFDSPAFFLQQNDVIYAKPKGTKIGSNLQYFLTIASTTMTTLSLVSTLLLWTNLAK